MKKQRSDIIHRLNNGIVSLQKQLSYYKKKMLGAIYYFYSKLLDINNPIAQLMRIHRPVPYLLAVMPAWWVVAFCGQNILQIIFLSAFFLIGAIVMRSAGCIINDIIDRNFDGLVERTKNRPLVTGAVNLKEALFTLLALLLIGFIMLMMLPKTSIAIGVISVIPICLYPLMKRWINFPQVFLGLIYNIGALIAWTTIYDSLSWLAFVIYFAAVCWTVGYDTIYAYQDMEDDIKANIKSSAVTLGDFGPKFIWSAYKLTIVTICIAGLNTHMNFMFYVINAIAAYALYRQIEMLDINDSRNCAKRMNENVEFGFWVLLAILIGRIQ